MSARDGGAQIGDVARVAGVSTTTVSRVLNGHAGAIRISAATEQRVRQAAMALRYRPNASARSLRTTKTKTIGVIAEDLLHPFVAELLRTVYATCDARGYHLLLGHAEHSRSAGWELSDILHSDRVDGVLLIGDILAQADEPQGREEMDRLVRMHRCVVSVGSRPSVSGELSVSPDFARGTYLAMEHLLALGHRVIGYIGVRIGPESWEDRQRLDAYRGFLDAHGLPRHPADEMIIAHNSIEDAQAALQAMLMRPQRPTALFVNNDFLAIIVLKAALLCGIHVPAALSVVGFDDISFAALCTPSLTTVHYPIDDMARRAATALLDRIEGLDVSDGAASVDATVVFAPTLVWRESSGPPGR